MVASAARSRQPPNPTRAISPPAATPVEDAQYGYKWGAQGMGTVQERLSSVRQFTTSKHAAGKIACFSMVSRIDPMNPL